MLSYFGDSIESTSDEMSTAIYQNEWIETDAEYKNNLFMMMINTIHPLKLKAAKVFEVNMPNFLFVSPLHLFIL